MSRCEIGIFGWLGCRCMIDSDCSPGSDWTAIDVGVCISVIIIIIIIIIHNNIKQFQ